MMEMKKYVFRTLCFFVIVVVVVGFPSGPPEKVCLSMSALEGHGRSKVGLNPAPYQLLVTNRTYEPFQHIKVILTGEVNFRGFFVQARSMDGDSAIPIGSFIKPHVGSKTMSCSSSSALIHNAWSHSDKYYKSDISVTWIAPPKDQGYVFFRAIVVQERTMYWESLFSDIISYNGPVIQYGGENHDTGGSSRHLTSITNILLHITSFLMFYY